MTASISSVSSMRYLVPSISISSGEYFLKYILSPIATLKDFACPKATTVPVAGLCSSFAFGGKTKLSSLLLHLVLLGFFFLGA